MLYLSFLDFKMHTYTYILKIYNFDRLYFIFKNFFKISSSLCLDDLKFKKMHIA